VYVNRRASFEYELLDRYEAGMALTGSEIKSLRQGGVDFRDAYAAFQGNNLELIGLYIPAYPQASYNNHAPRRPRRLLLHRHELYALQRGASVKGFSMVPTKIYFKGPYAKVEIALARGKKLYDKRRAEAEKTLRRELRDL
jgi:SsrA-binding protein